MGVVGFGGKGGHGWTDLICGYGRAWDAVKQRCGSRRLQRRRVVRPLTGSHVALSVPIFIIFFSLSPSPDTALFTFATLADFPDASPQSMSGYIHRLHTSSLAREHIITFYLDPCLSRTASLNPMITIMIARACGGTRAWGLDKRHLGDLCLGHRPPSTVMMPAPSDVTFFFSYHSPASPPLRETLIDQRLIVR